MRMTRTMMLEVLRQDYIRTAWSKRLRERVVVIRHAVFGAMEHAYFKAARAVGSSRWRTLVHHLLPNIAPVLIVIYSINIRMLAALREAGVQFVLVGGMAASLHGEPWAGLCYTGEGRLCFPIPATHWPASAPSYGTRSRMSSFPCTRSGRA